MTAIAPPFGTTPPRPPRRAPGRLPRLPGSLCAAVMAAVAALGLLLAAAPPAAAHAALTGSDPKDGAVVATAPATVTLSFSEQVALGDDSIRVLEPSGKRADTGELQDLCSGSQVKYGVTLHSGLPDGTYTVAWQAVSADSHPVAGAFTFSIGAPSETSVALPDQEVGGGLVGALYGIARYASYGGFILLVGGAAFVLACWPRGATVRAVQRLVVYGWVALAAATLALLLLRSPYTGSGRLTDAFDLAGLGAVLETKTGTALISRLLLLGAAALFVAVLFGAYARRYAAVAAVAGAGAGGKPGAEGGSATGDVSGAGSDAGAGDGDEEVRKDLAFGLAVGGGVVAAGIAGTWALSEHASTGLQPGVAMPVDILHLLAMAGWLGGLVALLVTLHREPSIEPAAVRRFSRLAFGSVAVLVATGIYQSWRQVGTWSALTGTSYGQVLLVKIALVVGLVALARFSRRWTGQLTEGADGETMDRTGGPGDAGTTEATEAREATEVADRTERIGPGEGAGEARGVAARGGAAGTGRSAGAEVSPERAAQLARQRAAVASARKQRARNADSGRAGLRRSVLAEAGVAVVLLAVTTVLTSTEPARTQEEADRDRAGTATTVPDRPVDLSLPFDTGGRNGKGTVRLSLDPGRSGANVLHVLVDGADGKPLDVPEVKVSFTLKEQKIGPLPAAPERIAAGHWSAENLQIPMPGEWTLQVTVRTSDIDQTTLDKNVKIG
ncbi:copper resistance protein CopC [Streptomyces sp. LP05-1]|uniref:Copper resistance protein CopC n=1 Tax=Streptomyces pyxinae TaxID=2970734 RepID=A0ABT2CER9_9ACTN|nr:copper resistance protein CopC [Streptomyces sp. LP05-1]MCS0635134.1 copper resistance protein CopC [Streptomyces sp. LP05-1]